MGTENGIQEAINIRQAKLSAYNSKGLGCGLACHVGYLVGIPTIGMAKNFTGFPILFNNPQLPAHNIEEVYGFFATYKPSR